MGDGKNYFTQGVDGNSAHREVRLSIVTAFSFVSLLHK